MTQTATAVNRSFLVEKKGKQSWVLIRQIPGHDPTYKIGSHIPSYGRVVAVADQAVAA